MGAESLSPTPETLVARTGVVAVGVVRSGWGRWRLSPQICCQVRGGACEKEHREMFGVSICKDRDREKGRGSTLEENVSSPIGTR